jgi:hypothetical protein
MTVISQETLPKTFLDVLCAPSGQLTNFCGWQIMHLLSFEDLKSLRGIGRKFKTVVDNALSFYWSKALAVAALHPNPISSFNPRRMTHIYHEMRKIKYAPVVASAASSFLSYFNRLFAVLREFGISELEIQKALKSPLKRSLFKTLRISPVEELILKAQTIQDSALELLLNVNAKAYVIQNKFNLQPDQLNTFTTVNHSLDNLPAFPLIVTQMPSLSRIQMTAKLHDVPSSLYNAPHSKTFLSEGLHLNGNHFRSIDPSIEKLTIAPVISFQYNQITHLPKEVASLNCSKLNLDKNPIVFLPSEILSSTKPFICNNPVVMGIKIEIAFVAKSPWALFYQRLMTTEDPTEAIFGDLDQRDRDKIYQLISEDAGEPIESQWGKQHAFDRGRDARSRLYLAVRSWVAVKYKERNMRYAQRISRELVLARNSFAPLRNDIFSNIPRLLETLYRYQSKS